MLHVPGRYSGGISQGHTWTQTRSEVELRVPIPDQLVGCVSKCEIDARRYRLWWEPAADAGVPAAATAGTNEDAAGMGVDALGGELSSVVVVGDSLWSVEQEGGSSTVVVSFRKAVPGLWTRLLSSDAEAPEPPKLLDAPERKAQRSKEELLREAKERAGAALDGPSKAEAYLVDGRVGERIELDAADLPQLPVMTIRGCVDCTVVVPSTLVAVKIAVEGCTRTALTINGKVITETLEAWKCTDCAVHTTTSLSTVQVDNSVGVHLFFSRKELFTQLLSTGCFALSVGFADAPTLGGTVDLNLLRRQMPEKGLSDTTDQFITRVVDGQLLTELIIRLANDYPTTERESATFAARTQVRGDKLEQVVGNVLGSGLGGELSEAEREKMATLVREQSDQASAAKVQTEQTAEGRLAARIEHKRNAGNDAFKAANYQQAAVCYTEAIALCTGDAVHTDEATLRSNRAACFLKLGRYAQAREDAEACIALKPDFAKGHFRLALALQHMLSDVVAKSTTQRSQEVAPAFAQAEERFADACHAFNRVLQLEPKNKDAASGLRMAEVQAERARRAEAM